MENTGKVLFEDESPQWYIAQGDRWVGPLSAGDVYQRVVRGEISWAHFVWKAGQADWKRLCDIQTFQAAVPTLPSKDLQKEVKEASRPGIKTASAASREKAPVAEAKTWFLYYNHSQFGPFSTEEVQRFLNVGKLHGRVHAWQDGMADWVRLETLQVFAEAVTQSKTARDSRKAAAAEVDKRQAPRRPLVAKILMANQEALTVAVCRDVSVGGMQVLTDRIPGEPGARIKMNVSPAGKAGAGEIEPFVAEGVIVRILEDGRGFSFRFERLAESSRKAIEKYIETVGDLALSSQP